MYNPVFEDRMKTALFCTILLESVWCGCARFAERDCPVDPRFKMPLREEAAWVATVEVLDRLCSCFTDF